MMSLGWAGMPLGILLLAAPVVPVVIPIARTGRSSRG
jgi:hypothetical protein